MFRLLRLFVKMQLYLKVVVGLFSMPKYVICVLLKCVIFSKICFSLTAEFITEKCDFVNGDILKRMFCTLIFIIVTLVCITTK